MKLSIVLYSWQASSSGPMSCLSHNSMENVVALRSLVGSEVCLGYSKVSFLFLFKVTNHADKTLYLWHPCFLDYLEVTPTVRTSQSFVCLFVQMISHQTCFRQICGDRKIKHRVILPGQTVVIVGTVSRVPRDKRPSSLAICNLGSERSSVMW